MVATMKNGFLMVGLVVVFGLQPAAAGWYFEIGVGLTAQEFSSVQYVPPGESKPRTVAIFAAPLGKALIGFEAAVGWALELEHISSISDSNDGYGINALWAVKRVRFD